MAFYGRRSSFSRPSSYAPKKAPVVVEFQAPTFAPSDLQQAILRAVRETDSSIICDAVAGSGKTTTGAFIVREILDMKRSYVFVAFNKSIANVLVERGMNGKTFHSLGYSAVMGACAARNNGVKPTLDANKVSVIVENLYGRENAAGYSGAIVRLVSLAKNHMMRQSATDDDIMGLIEHFDIDWDDDNVSDSQMCSMVRETLAASIADTRTIDFDDQLYLVWYLDLRMTTYDFILVDESQDTNPLRRNLIRRMMHKTSRVIAVGDPYQAIYGFTGASHDSMDQIARDFECVTYPLSVSYRCSQAVIRHAQEIVPHIQAAPNAPEGSMTRPASFKRSDFLPTDLVMCRNTAPLVSVAYKLLAARIPCKIMGREIGRSLTGLIKRLSRKNETLESLADRLLAHRASETEKLMRARKETKAQALQDKVDAIMAILDSMTPEDTDRGIPGLVAIIEGMFSDTRNGCVTLATCHKAKGLEAPRAFILDAKLMPSKMARQDWQMAQERNLMYVARTRAMLDLVYIDSDKLTD